MQRGNQATQRHAKGQPASNPEKCEGAVRQPASDPETCKQPREMRRQSASNPENAKGSPAAGKHHREMRGGSRQATQRNAKGSWQATRRHAQPASNLDKCEGAVGKQPREMRRSSRPAIREMRRGACKQTTETQRGSWQASQRNVNGK